jgi:hypothetical protein
MKPIEIYTDASTKQLGAAITQENRPIAFFQLETLWRAIKIHRYQTRTLSHCGNTKRVQWNAVGTMDKCLHQP